MFWRNITKLLFHREKAPIGLVFYIGTGKTHVINMSRGKFTVIRAALFAMLLWGCIGPIILAKLALVNQEQRSEIVGWRKALLGYDLQEGHAWNIAYESTTQRPVLPSPSVHKDPVSELAPASIAHSSNSVEAQLSAQERFLEVVHSEGRVLTLADVVWQGGQGEYSLTFRLVNSTTGTLRRGYVLAVAMDAEGRAMSIPAQVQYDAERGTVGNLTAGHRFSLRRFAEVRFHGAGSLRPKWVKVFVYGADKQLLQTIVHSVNASPIS